MTLCASASSLFNCLATNTTLKFAPGMLSLTFRSAMVSSLSAFSPGPSSLSRNNTSVGMEWLFTPATSFRSSSSTFDSTTAKNTARLHNTLHVIRFDYCYDLRWGLGFGVWGLGFGVWGL